MTDQTTDNALDGFDADETAITIDDALAEAFEGRHPSIVHYRTGFDVGHLAPHLVPVAAIYARAAVDTLAALDDHPEVTTALRKLREGKDCAVLAAVLAHEAREVTERRARPSDSPALRSHP